MDNRAIISITIMTIISASSTIFRGQRLYIHILSMYVLESTSTFGLYMHTYIEL